VVVGGLPGSAAALAVTDATLNASGFLSVGRGTGDTGVTSTATLTRASVNAAGIAIGSDGGVKPGETPVPAHLGVHEVLVDRGELGGQHVVEHVDQRGVAGLHGNSGSADVYHFAARLSSAALADMLAVTTRSASTSAATSVRRSVACSASAYLKRTPTT
jgi:hypothetical protein